MLQSNQRIHTHNAYQYDICYGLLVAHKILIYAFCLVHSLVSCTDCVMTCMRIENFHFVVVVDVSVRVCNTLCVCVCADITGDACVSV